MLHTGLLVSVARSVLRDTAEAEDCVHDVMLKLLSDPSRYDERRGTMKSFLVVSVRNAAISRKRNAARRAQIDVALHPELVTEPEIPDYIERTALLDALHALPAEQLAPLKLAYFSFMTHAEIAAKLDLPLGTVKSRIALAMRKLRGALPPRGER